MNAKSISVAESNTRVLAVLGSAIFLFVAPGTVAGYIPRRICGWHVHASFTGLAALQVSGGLLMAAGFIVLIEAFSRFALQGIGTPAPILPTRHLVVTGCYRFVRNPMYVAVVSLILGQGLFFADIRLFAYGLTCWFAMHLFVLIYEEPTLRKTFADEYAEFSTHVPRWIPRLTPWQRSAK